MARRKKTTRRRAPRRLSLIDAAASFAVANAGTRAFFGTGIVPFLTEGWLTTPSTSWSYSGGLGPGGSASTYAVSLSELVKGMIPGGEDGGYQSYAWSGKDGIQAVMARSMNEFGPQALATAVIVPLSAKIIKRVARRPIRDANKLLKWTGISSALGVKV